MAAAALESPAFAAPNSSLLDSQPQRMETDGDLGVGAAVGSGPTVTGATPSASKMDNTETSLPPTAPRATAPQPNASPNMDAPLSAPTPVHFSFPPSVRLPPIATSPPRTAPPASSQPEPTSPYSSRDYEARSAAISAASALLFLRHSPHPASPHSDSGSFFDSPYPGRFGTPPLRGRERDRDRDRVDRPSSTPPSVVGFSLSAYSAQLNDDSGSISGPGTSGPIVPPPRSRASQSPSPYPYSHAVIEGEPGQRLRRACESCRQLRVPCDGGKRPGCGRCVGKGRQCLYLPAKKRGKPPPTRTLTRPQSPRSTPSESRTGSRPGTPLREDISEISGGSGDDEAAREFSEIGARFAASQWDEARNSPGINDAVSHMAIE